MKRFLSSILIFLCLGPLDWSQASASGSTLSKKTSRVQSFLSSPVFLKKIMTEDGGLYFESCDRRARNCQILTRTLSPEEVKLEKQSLEKEIRTHFRKKMEAGTVLFSDSMICTEVGMVMAAVPGLAGGAVICFEPQDQKLLTYELPLNILALNQLASELGSRAEVVTQGEDGEVYVANLDLIMQYLKNRYPKENVGRIPSRPNENKNPEAKSP